MATGDSTCAATTTSVNYQQNTGIEQQKIIIQNNCGEKLVDKLHETGSIEIEYSMMVELAVALEKQGISAFRFDFSGNGLYTKQLLYIKESEGTFEFGNYRKEVNDLHAVVRHFIATNRVISAILGHSKGGNVVVLYTSLHHDILVVVNVSGRYKMDRGIEERLGKDYLEREKKTALLTSNRKQVLTIHGSEDEIIPVEDGLEFSKIIPNHKLQIVEGADHCYNKHREELVSTVLAFIKENQHRV
ncbi:alpha/beta hydrolase fold protein [Tanacetum coccineum]